MITTSAIRIRVTTAGMIDVIATIAGRRTVGTDLPAVDRAVIRITDLAMADLMDGLMDGLVVDLAHPMANNRLRVRVNISLGVV